MNTLSQYLVESIHVHLVVVKYAMRYLKGTINSGLNYTSENDFRLFDSIDSDWVGSVLDRKNNSRGCFSLGSSMISWLRRKQSNISLCTAATKYIAACSTSCEAIWLRKLLSNLFDLEMDATMFLCDNQSCMKMAENPLFHDKTKHIEIRYFYICDMVQK